MTLEYNIVPMLNLAGRAQQPFSSFSSQPFCKLVYSPHDKWCAESGKNHRFRQHFWSRMAKQGMHRWWTSQSCRTCSRGASDVPAKPSGVDASKIVLRFLAHQHVLPEPYQNLRPTPRFKASTPFLSCAQREQAAPQCRAT